MPAGTSGGPRIVSGRYGSITQRMPVPFAKNCAIGRDLDVGLMNGRGRTQPFSGPTKAALGDPRRANKRSAQCRQRITISAIGAACAQARSRAHAAPNFVEEPWKCRNSHSHSGCSRRCLRRAADGIAVWENTAATTQSRKNTDPADAAVMARSASRAQFPRRSDLSQRGRGSHRPLLNRNNAVPQRRTYMGMAPPST